MPKPIVYILTWCPSLDRLPATLLVFSSIRTGFPTAEVIAVDNGSDPECAKVIRVAAEDSGCVYLENRPPVDHHDFIGRVISLHGGQVVFLDADIQFWESVENRPLLGLVAGRLIPEFQDPFSGCLTMPRLHTSFLWVDCGAMKVELSLVQRLDFHPTRPVTIFDGKWKRFDTGANLYRLLADKLDVFSEADLDKYDHLFCGSHFDAVMGCLSNADVEVFRRADQLVTKTGNLPKGLWRQQETFFRSHAAA